MMRTTLSVFAFLCGTSLSACSSEAKGVGPFYLMTPEREIDTALFRCFKEDGEIVGCEQGHFPGPLVFALGGNSDYIVFARHPKIDNDTVSSETEYFFFRRMEREAGGMGVTQESIVGPLNKEEFNSQKARLELPEFSIVREDLEKYGQ